MFDIGGEIVPEPKYNYSENLSYENLYEQYYFKSKEKRKIKPVRKTVKQKKKTELKKVLPLFAVSILLIYVLSLSFKTFIADILPVNSKKILKADYYKLLFPTHNYLYKDLFLGKYIIKDTEYDSHIMVNIKETFERNGLKTRLQELANNYRRIKPSVYIWEYDNGSFVDINADEPYPAASIIKIPVLIEMFRQIEQGKFSLSDTMILEDYYRASGSGRLQYSQGGIAHTMDYLAKIMIQNSDNSSTNMIVSKMGGMPELNRAMNRWGLKITHINNWLPDLDGTNVTTARELAKMFYNIDATNIISSPSKKRIANYLSHVKNNRLLQAGLPDDAILLHKTGDIGFMLGDAGIVKTATGKKYIVIILAKRPYNNMQGKDFIVKASKIIYNNML